MKPWVLGHPEQCLTLFVWGLYVPLLIVTVIAKWHRLPFPGGIGILRLMDVMRSEVLWIAALGWTWLAVLRLPLAQTARQSLLGFAIVQWLALAFFEVAGHIYFTTSGGTTLDLEAVGFVVANLGEFGPVLASEVPRYAMALGLAIVAWPLLWLWVRPWRPQSLPFRRAMLASVPVCLVGALLPTWHAADRSVGRDLALASISSFLLEATDPTVPVEEHGFPISARLEEREGNPPYHNVVLIILESMRARSTTVHTPDLPTTPYLAELAKQSVVFEQTYTTVPRTSKALVSILCGIRPHFAVAITEASPGGMPARCLAALFGERGFDSAYFQSATQAFENRRALVANMGFDAFFPLEAMNPDGFEEANYFGLEDDVMLPVSKTWLQGRGDRPFLAAYLTVTSHHPYFAPSARYGRLDLAADEELNRYLNTVRYQDFFVRNLIAQYKALGLYDDTLFVIVSDHGEGFDEHGRNHHNTVIYEEGLRVLFMVHAPGRFPEGHRVTPPTTVMDVLPTVTDLMGYDVINGRFPGRSMWDVNGLQPIIASCFRVRACMSIRRGDYKLIHHFQNRQDELFNVIEDPLEQHDLRASRPQLATDLVEELEEFRLHATARYARFHQDRISQRLSASN